MALIDKMYYVKEKKYSMPNENIGRSLFFQFIMNFTKSPDLPFQRRHTRWVIDVLYLEVSELFGPPCAKNLGIGHDRQGFLQVRKMTHDVVFR